MTEGGVDGAGVFHEIPRMDDSRLAEEPPPFHVFTEVALAAAEESGDYF